MGDLRRQNRKAQLLQSAAVGGGSGTLKKIASVRTTSISGRAAALMAVVAGIAFGSALAVLVARSCTADSTSCYRLLARLHLEPRIDGAPLHVGNMSAYLRRMDPSIKAGSLIFLGDSLTQSLAVTSVHPDSVNFGIGQQDTVAMLRFIAQLRSLERAKVLVISIGTNDVLHGRADGLAERLEQIHNALPPGRPVIWSSIMPVNTRNVATAAAQILAANQRIRDLCAASNARCTYVDTWNLFAEKDGRQKQQYFLADGIHLNDSGYAIWIARLKEAVASIEGNR